MTAHDPKHIENDADRIRRDIADTAEAIQDRMSPGKLIDDAMAYMKRSDGAGDAATALGNLRRQASDNPMALAVIGSGIAWLMFGDGEDRGSPRDGGPGNRQGQPSASARRASGNGGERGPFSAATSTVADGVDTAADKASDLAGRARHAFDDVSDRARDMADDAVDRGHAAADGARDLARRGRRSIMDAMEREPLVLGAIGMAVGAAIGGMLPGTAFEDETMSDMRDDLLRGAGHAVDQAADSARRVGGKAFEIAKAEASEATPG